MFVANYPVDTGVAGLTAAVTQAKIFGSPASTRWR
jgi:hypothetical protein